MTISMLRPIVAVAATAVAAFGLARASSFPMTLRNADSARLRLSWSARPERIEVCRTLSDEELAKREAHMRQRVECDGRFASYSLRIAVDGRVLDSSVVRGAGLRHDRALYLLRDFALPPGTRRIQVAFTRRESGSGQDSARVMTGSARLDSGIFVGRAQRETEERTRRRRAAIPARLQLDTVLSLAARHVVVVTIDAEARALRIIAEK